MTFEETLEEIIRRVVREEFAVLIGSKDEGLLTAEQAAERIGCNKQRIYTLKREGHLKAVYTGDTHFKFAPDEVRRFIREQGTKHIASRRASGVQFAPEVN